MPTNGRVSIAANVAHKVRSPSHSTIALGFRRVAAVQFRTDIRQHHDAAADLRAVHFLSHFRPDDFTLGRRPFGGPLFAPHLVEHVVGRAHERRGRVHRPGARGAV